MGPFRYAFTPAGASSGLVTLLQAFPGRRDCDRHFAGVRNPKKNAPAAPDFVPGFAGAMAKAGKGFAFVVGGVSPRGTLNL